MGLQRVGTQLSTHTHHLKETLYPGAVTPLSHLPLPLNNESTSCLHRPACSGHFTQMDFIQYVAFC